MALATASFQASPPQPLALDFAWTPSHFRPREHRLFGHTGFRCHCPELCYPVATFSLVRKATLLLLPTTTKSRSNVSSYWPPLPLSLVRVCVSPCMTAQPTAVIHAYISYTNHAWLGFLRNSTWTSPAHSNHRTPTLLAIPLPPSRLYSRITLCQQCFGKPRYSLLSKLTQLTERM